jgi:hypothetical protein
VTASATPHTRMTADTRRWIGVLGLANGFDIGFALRP